MKDTIYRADAIELLTKIVFDEPPYLVSETLCRKYAEEQINTLPSAEYSNAKTQNSNQETQKSNGDLIYRADAIEAVQKLIRNNQTEITEWLSFWVIDEIRTLPSAEAEPSLKAIKRQIDEHWYLDPPSAEAVQRWIPCSERLPSESGDYLATIPLDADETYTEVLTFHKGRFYEDDDEWGETYHDDVLAWMPLPTPYKGGDDE